MKGKELILLLTTKLKDMVDKSGIEKVEFDKLEYFLLNN